MAFDIVRARGWFKSELTTAAGLEVISCWSCIPSPLLLFRVLCGRVHDFSKDDVRHYFIISAFNYPRWPLPLHQSLPQPWICRNYCRPPLVGCLVSFHATSVPHWLAILTSPSTVLPICTLTTAPALPGFPKPRIYYIFPMFYHAR